MKVTPISDFNKSLPFPGGQPHSHDGVCGRICQRPDPSGYANHLINILRIFYSAFLYKFMLLGAI